MKSWKKGVAITLSACMLMATPVFTVQADDNENVNDSSLFEIDENGVLTNYIGSDKEVVIPDGVTVIGEGAFTFAPQVTSVTIPDGVTCIEEGAFVACYDLENIEIPASVTSIGKDAFLATKWLENRQQENPLVIVNHILLDGTTCTGDTVEIPDGVTCILPYAFEGCTDLVNIDIPESVVEFGNRAFFDTKWLAERQEEDSLVIVNQVLIDGSTTVGAAVIPEGVTCIAEGAFYDCNGLQRVEIPSSVTAIMDEAFAICTNLHNISIPSSVEKIGELVFNACKELETINVAQDNKVYDSREDCNALIETASNTLLTGCQNTVIPADVKVIEEYAFCGCDKLEAITVPDSVTEIGMFAFGSCTSLTSITLSKNLKMLSDQVFSGCVALERLDIPSGVTEIGYQTFGDCESLAEVLFPETIKKIDYQAFLGCKALTNIELKDGVEEIESYAFQGCEGLETVTIPPSVTSIGNNIFSRCKDTLVIRGYKGSEAEKYATDQEYTFEIIGYMESDTVKDMDYYDVADEDGEITFEDAYQILKYALNIESSENTYELEDAQDCLKIALGLMEVEE